MAEFKMLSQGISYVFTGKKRAIYVGCLGMGNLGDEAVYIATKHLLKQKLFLYKVPYQKPFSGKLFRRYFFRPPDYIILGGGTLVLKNAKESFLRIILGYKNKYPKAKLVVFGTGVADPILAKQNGFPTNIEDWRTFFDLCEFVSVRGILSKKLLEDKFEVIKKPIFILHEPTIQFRRTKIIEKSKNKVIGINFCDIVGRIYGQDQEGLGLFFKNLVIALLDQGWTVYLYPTVVSDIKFMKKQLGEELTRKILIYDNHKDLKKSLKFFEEIDVFIGQRLHSIVFSTITYTPFFAIEYESKMSDFLLTLGCKDKTMRTDLLDLGYLLNKIDSLYKNIEEEQKVLFDFCWKASQQQLTFTENFLNDRA